METEMTGKTSEVTIFLRSGSTLMFYDCEILSNYGDTLHDTDQCDLLFTYVSASTKLKKRALFCTSCIAGHSFQVD